MEDFWAGCGRWSEEQEQAFQDRWALRVLTCPRGGCRRAKSCTMPADAKRACPALIADPFTKDEQAELVYRTRFALQKVADERLDGTFEEKRAAREKVRERRVALAFERAREVLRERGRGRKR